ncbi:MAG: phosphatidate cytidylyltransferase, partial [Gammaproteobacteria bacterium]
MASRELMLRVVTALVLAPLVLAALLALPTPWFALFLLLFIALAAWEWAALSRLVGGARVAFLALVAAAAASLWWLDSIRLPVVV